MGGGGGTPNHQPAIQNQALSHSVALSSNLSKVLAFKSLLFFFFFLRNRFLCQYLPLQKQSKPYKTTALFSFTAGPCRQPWGPLPRPQPFQEMGLNLITAWEITFPSLLLRRRQWHPTPVILPGKSHGWRSLEGCSAWDCWGSDTTERLPFHFSLSCIGEGNVNPLQCSCLENPRDRGAWWAAVSGVAQSRTRLSDFTLFFTFMRWRRKCQPTPVFLPGESQEWQSLVGCHLWGRTESDMTEAT